MEKFDKKMRTLLRQSSSHTGLKEAAILLAFFSLTALMTWPYVTRLRDAVAGPGDPYLIAWTMWWDYHQTFSDPLNLFHANVFYPYRYTLVFSEHCYGLALPFFPLFALGFRPLTVHAVAMFFGFALSGYGAFRLARTLTGSSSIAWVTGIMFAFVPYRFGLMAQLMYLFSLWIPLLFEAFVLFARERSWKRAAWLGFAFFMTGLTTITWLLFCLLPLVITGAILVVRYRLQRDGQFWQRGIIGLALASLALLPFVVPYYIASRLYGFKRSVDDVKTHSASAIHWLVAEGRNRLWRGLGSGFPDAYKFALFPGLLALLLPLAELLRGKAPQPNSPATDRGDKTLKWVKFFDLLAVGTFAASIAAIGFEGSQAYGGLFNILRSSYTLTLFLIVLITRLSVSYPRFLRRGESANLRDTIRSTGRCDAFWCGMILTVIGFLYSIGWNSFFYRILFDAMPGFRGIRAPMRGAMFAYLGLAILSGLGTKRIAEAASSRFTRLPSWSVYVVVSCLLLLELNAIPLHFIRGDVFPDAITLRLKQTTMRGGIAYFPTSLDFNQRYMLRAADHEKPLIVGTSGFSPPYAHQLEKMTSSGAIPEQVMDLLETVPASYLVVKNHLIVPERKPEFEAFLRQALRSGRLRFVNRFDGRDDLYAVIKTEPDVKGESPALIELDP